MSDLLPVGPRDLEALENIRTAMYACNAADTSHLHYQTGGTFGFMHASFIDAATVIFSADVANRLMDYIINNGENVEYNLNIIRDELCPVCQRWIYDSNDHCSECGTCVGDKHSTDCVELECLGHESLSGAHMGTSAYCNGECRPKKFERS